MNDIDRIASSDYIPTDQDILRCRRRTSDISELRFSYNKAKFLYIIK